MWFLRTLDILFPPRPSERAVRAATADAVCALLSPITLPLETPSVALLPYRNELIRSLILETKFKDNERAASLLGAALEDFLLEYLAEHFPNQTPVLVPIPLSAKRERTRGYNQVQRVCAAALPRLPVHFAPDVLTRTKDTMPQTELSGRERRTNLEGAFTATNVDPSAIYIVVDDVTTTGTTLTGACEALKAAGASEVLMLALAH